MALGSTSDTGTPHVQAGHAVNHFRPRSSLSTLILQEISFGIYVKTVDDEVRKQRMNVRLHDTLEELPAAV